MLTQSLQALHAGRDSLSRMVAAIESSPNDDDPDCPGRAGVDCGRPHGHAPQQNLDHAHQCRPVDARIHDHPIATGKHDLHPAGQRRWCRRSRRGRLGADHGRHEGCRARGRGRGNRTKRPAPREQHVGVQVMTSGDNRHRSVSTKPMMDTIANDGSDHRVNTKPGLSPDQAQPVQAASAGGLRRCPKGAGFADRLAGDRPT
jgi:hypothetical protein